MAAPVSGRPPSFGLGGYIFGVIVARKLLNPELALLAALAVAAAGRVPAWPCHRPRHRRRSRHADARGRPGLLRSRLPLARACQGRRWHVLRLAPKLVRPVRACTSGPRCDGGHRVDRPRPRAARHHGLRAQPHRADHGSHPGQRGARALHWLFDHDAARTGLCDRSPARRCRRRDAGDLQRLHRAADVPLEPVRRRTDHGGGRRRQGDHWTCGRRDRVFST